MKFSFVILSIALLIDPGKIGKINNAKTEARKAYAAGDYKKAVEKYKFLTDSLNVSEDEVVLNLANSYFQTNDTTSAISTYQSLIGSTKPQIRSKAQQQLGILNHKQGKLEEALNNFKQAIKADPQNIDARYNYELLKKKLEEEKKKQDQKQNKDQQNKDQQNKDEQKKDKKDSDQEKKEQEQKDKEKKEQEQKDKENKEQQEKDQKNKDQQQKDQQDQKDKESNEKTKEQQEQEQKEKENKQEKSENSPQLSEKLQQMKISEEKAKMILEAMKNQEIQYLQQNKRKATQPKDKTKPDW